MKRILALTLCLGLASSLAAVAAPKDKEEKKERQAQRKVAKAAAKLERVQERAERGPRAPRADFQPAVNANVNPEVRAAVTAEARAGNRRVERRGPRNFSWSYDEARRNHRRGVRRDRNWYRNNYSRFALFAGGYYYFDRGYWYPAYGYDSGYTTYRFDEPIYGYNSLEPRQVLLNVQVALRRQGYYRGAIDGLIGPMTRSAVAQYQRDHGLYVTRAIDGPTLAALGLT